MIQSALPSDRYPHTHIYKNIFYQVVLTRFRGRANKVAYQRRFNKNHQQVNDGGDKVHVNHGVGRGEQQTVPTVGLGIFERSSKEGNKLYEDEKGKNR